MLVNFELEGQPFVGLNGGPAFHFTEAISFFVDCADQAEVDEMWARLSEGGEEGQCGWLKDRYGVSWQIVPKVLGELMGDPDPVKASRVMHAMLNRDEPDDFVVGTGSTYSVRQFAEVAFGELDLDYKDYVVVDERFYRPAEVQLLVADPSKTRDRLGWKPDVEFEDLVRMMVRADLALLRTA